MDGEQPKDDVKHRTEAETLAGPASAADDTVAGASSAPSLAGGRTSVPEQIGRYRIKRLIAEGGMGSVFEAIQEEPRRTVALKIMKAGITSRAALRRFAYESQILGRLRHPGIAQVYEAGTQQVGDGGVPYFAMEYIPGARILTEFVESKDLGTEDRLEIFLSVCDAVHHGHQKGIIHRDLKPQNILVDSTGQPKIIDFGIARATDSDLAMATLQTQVGELVGTVQYMSPEQCEADPHDLDIRSDVYALGMVLYEVLCGKLPYDVTHVGLLEATRVIRETRPTPLAPINSELKGDIETICFKALEKERDRRYQSAAELAADIRRFLAHEPILARPPSLLYQAKLFSRRHTALVAAGVTAVIALTIGFVGTAVGLVRARIAEEHAVKEAAVANESLGFLLNSLSALNARMMVVDVAGADAKVSDLIDLWSDQLDTSYGDMPEVRSRLRAAVGNGYKALSLYDESQAELEAALKLQRETFEEPHEAIATTLLDLGAAKWWRARDDRDQALFAESERDFRESLEMRRALYGNEHEEVARGLYYLAAAVDFQGRRSDAEALYREALEINERLAAADDIDREEQARREELVARSKNNLATCLANQGKFAEAEKYYRDAVKLIALLHDENHLDVGNGRYNIARCLYRQGGKQKLEAAVDLFDDAARIKRQLQGADHSSIGRVEQHYADALLAIGRYDDAETHAREARRVWSKHVAEDHWRIAAADNAIGAVRAGQERFEEAEPLLTASLERIRTQRGPEEEETLLALERVIALYERWGKPAEANRYRELLDAS